MKLIAVFSLSIILCGCASPWFKLGSGYYNNGYASSAGKTVGKQVWQFSTGLSIVSNAVLDANNNVYVTSTNGSAFALNSAGVKLWSFNVSGVAMRATPAVEGGRVYIGADDHNVYALDASTGKLLWTFATGDRVVAGVAPSGSTLFVASLDHKLYALNSATGKKNWEFKAGAPIYSSPAQSPQGAIYFGANDNKLYSVNATNGKLNWTRTMGGTVTAAPAVGVNGNVYVGSDDGWFHALDPTGNEIWTFNAGGVAQWWPAAVISLGGSTLIEVVYVASTISLSAVDAKTGNVTWQNPDWYFAEYGTSQPAVVPNGSLFIANNSELGAFLVAADSKTGARQWIWSNNSIAIINSPAVGLDGKIYVTSDDSNVYALQ